MNTMATQDEAEAAQATGLSGEAATGSGRADAADSSGAGTSGRRFHPGMLYAAIWLVFLVVPVIGIFIEGAALGWKILGLVAVALFGITYIWLIWRGFVKHGEPRDPGNGELIVGVAALVFLAALAIPAAGPWVTAFTPFMAAQIIFTRSPAVGIPIGLLIWGIPSVAAYILAGGVSFWIMAGPGMAIIFVIVIRITEFYEDKDRHRAQELRQAEERDQIARDVHDILGHSLTVLSVKAQLARRLIDADPDRARAELEAIEELTRESLSQVRSTVTRLKAPHLPGELDVAASTLESADITSRISSSLEGDGPPVLAWALREAITNVVRHSGATQCEISIGADRLRVVDDGVGLGETREGNGLRGLRERAKQADASVVTGRAYPELEGTTPERPGTMLEVRL